MSPAGEAPGRSRWTRAAFLAAGPLAFGLLAFVPHGLHRIEGFGHRPAFAAAVAVWMAVWWFSEAVPMAATACLPLVLFPALGVFGPGVAKNVVAASAPYVDAYIFLFLGGMALGAAMEQWNLHRRVALSIMRLVGTEPKRLLLGVLLATSLVSMWISNTATAVMMLPIALALVAQLEKQAGHRLTHFGAALMLAVAYAANVGGIGTKIGTATNSIFAGFLSKELGHELGFLQYVSFSLPFVVIFLPTVWLVLWRLGRGDAPAQAQGKAVLTQELRALGPLSGGETRVAAVFLAAASLWVTGDFLRPHVQAWLRSSVAALENARLLSKHYEAGVAMLALVVLLATRTVTLAALKRIPWNTLVLLGGSFAMAAGIEQSGLSTWLAGQLGALARQPLIVQTLIAAGATVLLSAFASNTATINVMLNVLPRSPAVLGTAAIAASCDFALPAGTPPNAIVFGSGYVRLPVMMRVGVLLDALAVLLLAGYGSVFVPLLLR